MKELENIYLEDSYVLSIKESSPPELICLFVLQVLHPLYRPPLPGEAHCYREGRLCFVNGSGFHWITKLDSRNVDIDGAEDLGNLYSIIKSGDTITVEGSFGIFQVKCHHVSVVFD